MTEIHTLETHRRYLARYREELAQAGIATMEPDTDIERGQPVSQLYGKDGVAVFLVGMTHAQVFARGQMQAGTRMPGKLVAAIRKAERKVQA